MIDLNKTFETHLMSFSRTKILENQSPELLVLGKKTPQENESKDQIDVHSIQEIGQ